MDPNGLEEIFISDKPLTESELIDKILPVRHDGQYTLDEIGMKLRSFHDSLEEIQNDYNNRFNSVLDQATREKLANLYGELQGTQMKVMKLQYDIARTRENFETIKPLCDNPLIRERRDITAREKQLQEQLQQMKFEPIRNFFERFVNHLNSSVANCRKLFFYRASNYSQAFEWAHYHQAMYLMKACGKTISDIERVEYLFAHESKLNSMNFKQQIEKMDLNNFIEFPALYSIESQLEVVDEKNQRLSFDQYISNIPVEDMMINKDCLSNTTEYLGVVSQRLRTITTDCCGLLIDLNLNYIEALFTDGINVDKLNKADNELNPQSSGKDETLPFYAFSPQEYITQIGQHLLTLRKQTEQFDTVGNEPLKLALGLLEHAQNLKMDVKSCKTVTETVLKCIARHCIRSLLGRTSHSILSRLTTNGRRQLITDALYLDNVLEDLSLLDPSEPYVEKFKNLLNSK